MQFIPKKTKFKKSHRNRTLSKVKTAQELILLKVGSVGLKSQQFGEITSKQIESMRQTVNKLIKKKGHISINIFAHTPVTAKPIETRMGKGKGNIDRWVSRVKTGDIICEIKTSQLPIGIKALKSCQIKLPIKTKIISQ